MLLINKTIFLLLKKFIRSAKVYKVGKIRGSRDVRLTSKTSVIVIIKPHNALHHYCNNDNNIIPIIPLIVSNWGSGGLVDYY